MEAEEREEEKYMEVRNREKAERGERKGERDGKP